MDPIQNAADPIAAQQAADQLQAIWGAPQQPATYSQAQIDTQNTDHPMFDPAYSSSLISMLSSVPRWFGGVNNAQLGTFADLVPRNPNAVQFADKDLSKYSNADLQGLADMVQDEKRGNWMSDLVALSSQPADRADPGVTATNPWGAQDFSAMSTPKLVDLMHKVPLVKDSQYNRFLPWSGYAANRRTPITWTDELSDLIRTLYQRGFA